MPTTTRFSVAKTAKGYGSAVAGSAVKSETEQWQTVAYPPSVSTTKLT
mgnify:FL=1